jgi:tetratricopeptide (TPR) repeat protein
MVSSSAQEGDRPPGSFVGRERELAELRTGLGDVTAGHGHLFLLSGEPGIGKTRLADEFARLATAQGARVVWGRCWEGGGAPAYWPVIQILRACVDDRDSEHLKALLGSSASEIARLIPELKLSLPSAEETKATSDPESARFRLFDAVATLLKNVARSGPLLIVVDDLHDSDQPSLQMLRFIARAARDVSLLIIGTYRDAEVKRSQQLGKLVGDLLREGRALSLSGLSKTEVGDFIASRTGRAADERLVADLYSATDGNALYVEGVVRLLESEGKSEQAANDRDGFKIPDGVRESIRRQLAALSREANSLLSIASVVGNEFDTRLLERVSGSSAEQIVERLEEAVGTGIVTNGAAGYASYRFSHALIRAALYEDLAATRRIELHGEIGAAIEAIHQRDLRPHLAELAHHFRHSGIAEKAIDYSVRSGHASFAVFAYEEARSHWETALGLMDRHSCDNAEQRASILWRLTDVVGLDKGIEYSEAALSLYEQLGDEKGTARVHSRLAGQLSRTSVDDRRTRHSHAGPESRRRALEHSRKAETQVARLEDPVAAVHFWIGKALICFDTDQIDAGMAAAQRLMEIRDRAGNPGLAWSYGAADLAKFLAARGRVPEAESWLKSARDKSDTINDTMLSGSVALFGGDIYGSIGAQREAQAWYGRELLQPRSAQSELRPALQAGLANALGFTGDMREARRHAAEIGYPVPMLSFWEGNWAAADEELYARLAAAHANGSHSGERQCASGLGWLNRIRGEYGRAITFGERVVALAKEAGHIVAELFSRGELALALGTAGLTNEALPHLERCRQILATGADWYGMNHIVSFAEAVVAAGRDLDLAEEHFERSVENYRRFELVWRESDVFYYWGRALLEAGREARAVEKFDAALEIYRRIEAAQPWVDRVMTLRERCAVHPVKPGEHARGSKSTDAEVQSPSTDSVHANAPALTPQLQAPTSNDRSRGGSGVDNLFRREGDIWTITYEGQTLRLRDFKGLSYIARLLEHPGEEFHAASLVTGVAVANGPEDSEARAELGAMTREQLAERNLRAGAPEDAGEMLDAQAKAEYGRKLEELREELDEAKELGNPERIAKAEDEIEALSHELSRAIGRGGRHRRTGSTSERARLSVTSAIKVAIERVARKHARLAAHLSSTIRTGMFCSYRPDPQRDPVWHL